MQQIYVFCSSFMVSFCSFIVLRFAIFVVVAGGRISPYGRFVGKVWCGVVMVIVGEED